MWSLRKPSTEIIRRFLDDQRKLDLSYSFVGATATTPPAGFVVDHTRIRLGSGEAVFATARAALQRWDQFRLNWLEAHPSDTPIRIGEVVAVLAHSAGLWWLVPCRIVYVIDETGPIHRFGFAYGTLPDHAATGEERFLIEWNRVDDSVWYDILAFSRPRHLLARWGNPGDPLAKLGSFGLGQRVGDKFGGAHRPRPFVPKPG
jgi:uncharacterized protein (UPF0548 family)